MKELNINGVSFYYEGEEETLTDAPSKDLKVEDQRELLDSVKRLFDKQHIPFFLAFGTLLGAIRDHSFIKGDNDIDLMVKCRDEPTLFKSLPFFQDRGLELIRFYDHKLYSFRINNKTFVDVYILRKIDRHPIAGKFFYYCGFHSWFIPKIFFSFQSYIEFYSQRFRIPFLSKVLLRCWYGKDWRIPQSKKGVYNFVDMGIFKNIKELGYRL